MSREIISTDQAPAAIGPYSQAVKTNGLVFVSGQLPINPATGELVSGDIRAETRQTMTNVGAILSAAGSAFDRIIKTTLFISDMEQFAVINEVYAEFFAGNPPARACVEVARLPKDARVEVEAVAVADA